LQRAQKQDRLVVKTLAGDCYPLKVDLKTDSVGMIARIAIVLFCFGFLWNTHA
jgi:hypothetical protein